MRYHITFLTACFVLMTVAIMAQQEGSEISAQDSVADSSAWVTPSDSVHEELYVVAPAFEFIPGEDSPELVADRLSCISTTAFPFTYNRNVQSFIDYFTIRDREWTKSMLRKKDVYFPLFEKYLALYGLPDELKYLSIIESGLNPAAVSRARAVGLWQFMSATGKHYGLHSSWYWDDRMDPEKSTEAACRYLAELFRIFKDWPLALAAYNSGPGTVLKANRRSGFKNDFWQVYLHLPRETKAYVPQFIAIVYAMKYADNHNLTEPYSEQVIPNDTLHVKSYLDLKTFGALTGTCQDDLKQLNPQLKVHAVPDNGKTHILRIPVHAKDELEKNRAAILDSAGRSGKADFEKLAKQMEERQYIYYKVRFGNSLGSIAANHRVGINDLKQWNNLKGNMIHPGQLLKIMLPPGKSAQVAKASTQATPKPASGSLYEVQPGDTLWGIAKKFEGLTTEKLISLNNLSNNKITPGQKLVVK